MRGCVSLTQVEQLRLQLEGALQQRRQPLQLRCQPLVLAQIECAAHVAEMQSEQQSTRHLVDERFGRGH